MSLVGSLTVVKFGGSVLASGRDYLRAARVVAELSEEGLAPVVVVSAMKGVTAELLKTLDGVNGRRDVISRLRDKHLRALGEIARDGRENPEMLEGVKEGIKSLINELRKALWAIEFLGEVTAKVRDYVLSFGERLSAQLMSASLSAVGLDSKALTGREAGIVTDATYGEANPIHEVSRKLVRETVGSMLQSGRVPVITGFIAGTLEGAITTFGRGGSDYTATLVANYLGAREVILVTDVPGIMTANPSLVPESRLVELLSYDEAVELSYLGAKRFHPRTFSPVRDTEIRVRVTSPEGGKGTLITREGGGPPVKAMAIVPHMAVLSVIGTGMVGRLGTAATITSMFSKLGINISAILQPTSETSITFLIEESKADGVLKELNSLVDRGIIREVRVVKPVTSVSIVGEGVRDPEVARDIISKIPVSNTTLISWAPFSLNVNLVLPGDPNRELMRKIHREVILKWWIS